MKYSLIFIIIFIPAFTLAQCYSVKETEPPYYLNQLSLSEEEQELIDFFGVNIEFWEYSKTNRFCLYQIDSLNIKLTLSKNIAHNDLIKTPIYSHLLAYQYISKLELPNIDKELFSAFMAGYYYCHQNITKNWSEILNSTNLRIQKSKQLNDAMDSYINLFYDYNSESDGSINPVEKKLSFLEGTYYAMPPHYRMQIESETNYENNIGSLLSEFQKNRNNNTFGELNTTSLEDIYFSIIQVK